MTIDITSTHTYTGTPGHDLTTWLADTPHRLDDGDLVLTTPDGDIHPRPGALLVRWTDGAVTTASPRTAQRTYGPEGLAGRLHRAEATLKRVLWVIAHHPGHIADDPSFVLRALDARPTTIGICPPGCTGDCTPDPAVMARHDQI